MGLKGVFWPGGVGKGVLRASRTCSASRDELLLLPIPTLGEALPASRS